MSNLRTFLKNYWLHLVLIALVLASTVLGLTALQNAAHRMNESTEENKGELNQEENLWDEEETPVQQPVTDLPEDAQQEVSKPYSDSSSGVSSSGAGTASGDAAEGQDGSATSSESSEISQPSLWDKQPIQMFSGQDLFYNSTLKDWRTHNGADYAAEKGTAVTAAVSGSVLNVYKDALWGDVVEISDKEGRLWKYCGVTDPQVKQDDKVTAGQTIGTAGEIPSETWLAGHIHLECTQEEEYINPEEILKK